MLFFMSGRMCSALPRPFLLICSETSFWKTALKKKTHVSKRVQVVVGQFELLEGDELAAPVRSGGGGVRVDVKPPGHRGLCLPRHRPARHTHTHTNKQSADENTQSGHRSLSVTQRSVRRPVAQQAVCRVRAFLLL